MLSRFTKLVLVAILASSFAFGAQLGADIKGVKGDKEKTFMKFLDEMQKIGYVLSDPHERINDAYKTKFGSDSLDNLGFFSTAKDKDIRELLIKYPTLGGFSPFNMHIWKKKGEDATYYGHLNPEIMLDIVGIKNKKDRKKFVNSFTALDKLADKIMKPSKKLNKKIMFNKLPKKKLMEFTIKVDGALEDFVDEIQEKWEAAFEEAGYIVAGYKNFKETYDDAGLKFSKYDAYWVYSLCHFPFSNGVFNERPDAGIFAPCSVYMYVEKGKKVLHVGMPYLENWINVNGIKKQKHIKAIRDIDAEIIKVFVKELGAKHIR